MTIPTKYRVSVNSVYNMKDCTNQLWSVIRLAWLPYQAFYYVVWELPIFNLMLHSMAASLFRSWISLCHSAGTSDYTKKLQEKATIFGWYDIVHDIKDNKHSYCWCASPLLHNTLWTTRSPEILWTPMHIRICPTKSTCSL